MATVIRNPALVHCLNHFGLTPEEWRSIERKDEPAPRPENTVSDLVNYLADFIKPPQPPVDTQG